MFVQRFESLRRESALSAAALSKSRRFHIFSVVFVALAYLLLLTPYWIFGLLSLCFFAAIFAVNRVVFCWRLFAVVVISLLAASTMWCPLYEGISFLVTSYGYSLGVAYYLLPNLGLLPKMLDELLDQRSSTFLYWVLVVFANSILLVSMELVFFSGYRGGFKRFLQKFSARTHVSKILGLGFIVFSIASMGFVCAILLGEAYEVLRPILFLYYPLRISSVLAPFVCIPLFLAYPDLLKWLHEVLNKPFFSVGGGGIRCYHLFILFLVSSFLVLDFSITAPDDVEFCSVDDRLYYQVWRGVREGIGFYAVWKSAFPENTEACMHHSLTYSMWFLCDEVRCIKMEYFLVCSLGLLGAFFFAKRISQNAFLAALAALYMLSFFTTRVFWFMLDYWSAAPMVLAMAFLAHDMHVVSSALLVIAFFMKETTAPVLAAAALLYSLIPLAKSRRGVFDERYAAYALGLIVVLSFAAITYAFWMRVQGMFLHVFRPHHFIRQIAWFMYPIGLVNFLLAFPGMLSVRDRRLKMLLFLVVVATHLLFLTYNQPSEGAARNAMAAIAVEYLMAPLGIGALAETRKAGRL